MKICPNKFCKKIISTFGEGKKLEDANFYKVHENAERIPPDDYKATATGFSDWIFRLDKGLSRRSSLAMGKEGEKRLKGRELIPVLSDIAWHKENWINLDDFKIIYKDPLDKSQNMTPYKSSLLTLEEKPLQCRPDWVIKHRPTGIIIVIETKTTSLRNFRIPEAGWANLTAQLWCYSWIDDWLTAPDVIIVGCIHECYGLLHTTPITPRTRRSSIKFNEICSALFRQYGGEINPNCAETIRSSALRNALLNSQLPPNVLDTITL